MLRFQYLRIKGKTLLTATKEQKECEIPMPHWTSSDWNLSRTLSIAIHHWSTAVGRPIKSIKRRLNGD